jgi:rubredoxin
MFQCKQCGWRFSANLPKTCPGCGTTNASAERSARGLTILLGLEALGTLVALVALGLVIALAVRCAAPLFG